MVELIKTATNQKFSVIFFRVFRLAICQVVGSLVNCALPMRDKIKRVARLLARFWRLIPTDSRHVANIQVS